MVNFYLSVSKAGSSTTTVQSHKQVNPTADLPDRISPLVTSCDDDDEMRWLSRSAVPLTPLRARQREDKWGFLCCAASNRPNHCTTVRIAFCMSACQIDLLSDH